MKYSLSIQTEEAGIYYEQFNEPFPVPLIGNDVFVGSDAVGYWTVVGVDYSPPQKGAHTPAFWITVTVKWSKKNNRPAPVYDEDQGWVK